MEFANIEERNGVLVLQSIRTSHDGRFDLVFEGTCEVLPFDTQSNFSSPKRGDALRWTGNVYRLRSTDLRDYQVLYPEDWKLVEERKIRRPRGVRSKWSETRSEWVPCPHRNWAWDWDQECWFDPTTR